MSPSSGRGSVRAAELRPLSWASFRMGVPRVGMAMTTIDRAAVTRHVYFHDPSAPVATVVVASDFVAVRWLGGRLLLVLFRARAVGGVPRGDLHESSEAAWVAPADLPGLSMEPPVRLWIEHALALDGPPHVG